MKIDKLILAIVISFIVGFITGATVAILRETKEVEKAAALQKPQPPSKPQLPEINPVKLQLKIQTLKDIIKKDPKNLAALIELGNLYFDTNQPKEAIEAYSQYLKFKPDNPDVRTDMGIMYRNLGDIDRAIEEFKKAAQSDPKHLNSRYNLGIVLLHDKKDINGAIKAWEDYLKIDPKSERANYLRVQIENMRKLKKETPDSLK